MLYSSYRELLVYSRSWRDLLAKRNVRRVDARDGMPSQFGITKWPGLSGCCNRFHLAQCTWVRSCTAHFVYQHQRWGLLAPLLYYCTVSGSHETDWVPANILDVNCTLSIVIQAQRKLDSCLSMDESRMVRAHGSFMTRQWNQPDYCTVQYCTVLSLRIILPKDLLFESRRIWENPLFDLLCAHGHDVCPVRFPHGEAHALCIYKCFL